MLRRLYPLINKQSKLHWSIGLVIYKALLRSVITYGCPVWGQASKTHIKKLQVFQNKVLRMITHLPRFIPIQILHRETRMDTIQEFIEKVTERFYNSTADHENELVKQLGSYDPNDYKYRMPKSLLR